MLSDISEAAQGCPRQDMESLLKTDVFESILRADLLLKIYCAHFPEGNDRAQTPDKTCLNDSR